MNRKVYAIAMLLFSLPVFSASRSMQTVCDKTPDSQKMVLKLSKNQQAEFCSLASYAEYGNDCGQGAIDFYLPHLAWKYILDLNHDGDFDLILSNGAWKSKRVYLVLLNCGNDSYVSNVFNYGELRPMPDNSPEGWLSLEANQYTDNERTDSDNEDFDVQYVVLKFDPEKSSYIKSFVGEIGTGFIVQDEKAEIPAGVRIEWDSYPTNVPHATIPASEEAMDWQVCENGYGKRCKE
jgi:hypothetical protein